MIKWLICLVFLPFLWAGVPVEDYRIDTTNSVVLWTGSYVTGVTHTGTVKVRSGSIQFSGGALQGGSVEINMNSMRSTDLDSEYAQKLVDVLKSEDFFAVSKFPSARFIINSVTPGAKKGTYDLKGNMTIKGVTQPVQCTAAAEESGNRISVLGKLTINRALFKVKYGSGTFYEDLGDSAINDEFDLQFSLIAVK